MKCKLGGLVSHSVGKLVKRYYLSWVVWVTAYCLVWLILKPYFPPQFPQWTSVTSVTVCSKSFLTLPSLSLTFPTIVSSCVSIHLISFSPYFHQLSLTLAVVIIIDWRHRRSSESQWWRRKRLISHKVPYLVTGEGKIISEVWSSPTITVTLSNVLCNIGGVLIR